MNRPASPADGENFMKRRLIALAGLLLNALLVPAMAAAQSGPTTAASAPIAPGAPGDTVWHIVRPGETLEQIASRYFGSVQRWKELHQLNPAITDPNRIEPGQRIRLPALR